MRPVKKSVGRKCRAQEILGGFPDNARSRRRPAEEERKATNAAPLIRASSVAVRNLGVRRRAGILARAMIKVAWGIALV